MLIGPEAHVSDEVGIELDISQYICIGLLILTALFLTSYILFIRCRFLRSRKCASCGQTVPLSGRERVEGFWQRVWHEGCWKATRGGGGEVGKVSMGRRGIGTRGGAAEVGNDLEKGGEVVGSSLVHPREIGGMRSVSNLSMTPIGLTTKKDTVHTPKVSSPLTTNSLPTLPYSDTSQIEPKPNTLTTTAQPILQPTKPYSTLSNSTSSKTLPKGTPSAPSSLPIPQPQLKPPPRQASLFIRQVQTYTPTTTAILPPRSTSMSANQYATLSQYDDSPKMPSGRVLHMVQEEEVPVMGTYKAFQMVNEYHGDAGRKGQALDVEVERLGKDDTRYGVAM